MVSGGVNKCIKYALLAFNFVFVILGALMVGIGISTLSNGFKYLKMVEANSFGAPPKIFIAIGVIMFLIAFLGCCGAWTENHSMIMAYSVLIGLILILQIGVGIAAFMIEDDLEDVASKGLTDTLQKYHNMSAHDVIDIRSSWDLLQTELKCCGVNNFTDWKGTLVNTNPIPNLANETLVPSSCCVGGAFDGCAKNITDINIDTFDTRGVIYNEGCLHKAVANLAIDRIGFVGIAVGIVELLGVLCACLLARSIRFSYETV